MFTVRVTLYPSKAKYGFGNWFYPKCDECKKRHWRNWHISMYYHFSELGYQFKDRWSIAPWIMCKRCWKLKIEWVGIK